MDPLRPVDPDEEHPWTAPDKPAANESDVVTSAEIQSASMPERRPADDRIESTDDPIGTQSDAIMLPPSSEASTTNNGSISSGGADVIPSSALDLVPNDAAPEPPSAIVDSALAAAEAGPLQDAAQILSNEPVDTASLPDVILPLGNRGSDASADRAILHDSWPDSNSAFYAARQQTPLPAIDPNKTDRPVSATDTGSFKDRSSLIADQESSRVGSPDDEGKQDSAPGKDGKSGHVDSQPEPVSGERKKDATLREGIERFIENFNAQSARTDALLSPPSDGGPPMARPIVLVSLTDEQMQGIANEALAESGSRLAKAAAEMAEDKVNEAFWLRDCEMRALYRGR